MKLLFILCFQLVSSFAWSQIISVAENEFPLAKESFSLGTCSGIAFSSPRSFDVLGYGGKGMFDVPVSHHLGLEAHLQYITFSNSIYINRLLIPHAGLRYYPVNYGDRFSFGVEAGPVFYWYEYDFNLTGFHHFESSGEETFLSFAPSLGYRKKKIEVNFSSLIYFEKLHSNNHVWNAAIVAVMLHI